MHLRKYHYDTTPLTTATEPTDVSSIQPADGEQSTLDVSADGNPVLSSTETTELVSDFFCDYNT